MQKPIPMTDPKGPKRSRWQLRERTPEDNFRVDTQSGLSGISLSLFLHLGLFLLLFCFVFSTERVEETLGLRGGILTEEELARDNMRDRKFELPSIPQGEVIKPISVPVLPEQVNVKEEFNPGSLPNVEHLLEGRKPRSGARTSEDPNSKGAVSLALAWLAKHQTTDGHWELHRGYDGAGRSTLRTDTGATSLALLCFLGAGHSHQEGDFQKQVTKGLDWLIGTQSADGNLHDINEFGRQTTFYAHAQATLVLLETLAMTGDEKFREPAERGVRFICESQGEHGGWRYQVRGGEGDLSVSGWQIQALQTARIAGIDVPENVWIKANQFIEACAIEGTPLYKYMPTDPDHAASPAMTAEGLLCRQYLGWPKDHPLLKEGVDYLIEQENLPEWSPGKRNVYHWYYATQVLHHMEGEAWETWNAQVREEILSNQVRGGKLGGSWHPDKPVGSDHEYALACGRLYITCLCVLTLEAPYRHLPLYR